MKYIPLTIRDEPPSMYIQLPDMQYIIYITIIHQPIRPMITSSPVFVCHGCNSSLIQIHTEGIPSMFPSFLPLVPWCRIFPTMYPRLNQHLRFVWYFLPSYHMKDTYVCTYVCHTLRHNTYQRSYAGYIMWDFLPSRYIITESSK